MTDSRAIALEGATARRRADDDDEGTAGNYPDWGFGTQRLSLSDPMYLVARKWDRGKTCVLRYYHPVDTGSASLVSSAQFSLAQSFSTEINLTDIDWDELSVLHSGHGAIYGGVRSENASEVRSAEEVLSEDIEALLDRLFVSAQDEQFEPGIESDFAKGLDRLFWHNPDGVLNSLKARQLAGLQDPEPLAEMLRWAGRQEARFIRERVVDLLSAGLNHPSSLVRDAAALGLAYLRDPAAIDYLKRAIEKETVPELRRDLEDLVSSLEQ